MTICTLPAVLDGRTKAPTSERKGSFEGLRAKLSSSEVTTVTKTIVSTIRCR